MELSPCVRISCLPILALVRAPAPARWPEARLQARMSLSRNGFRSGWNPHDHPQAAERAVFQRNISTQAAGDVPCDSEPVAGSAGILIARFVQPQECLEHVIALFGPNAWAI